MDAAMGEDNDKIDLMSMFLLMMILRACELNHSGGFH